MSCAGARDGPPLSLATPGPTDQTDLGPVAEAIRHSSTATGSTGRVRHADQARNHLRAMRTAARSLALLTRSGAGQRRWVLSRDLPLQPRALALREYLAAPGGPPRNARAGAGNPTLTAKYAFAPG
jgi:hypothetical protein